MYKHKSMVKTWARVWSLNIFDSRTFVVTRAWSSLPEPENPTGFCDFFKPEPELNPIFYISLNPMKPEPKVQTREYSKDPNYRVVLNKSVGWQFFENK